MSFIIAVRKKIISILWQNYYHTIPLAAKIIAVLNLLNKNNNKTFVLDHFALIDLPSENSGISVLNQIFSALDYAPQGRDYLKEKQNEFLWLAPREARDQIALEACPQIVIADFCLEDLTPAVREVILKYTHYIPAFPWRLFHDLCGKVYQGDKNSAEKLIQLVIEYCQRRDWPLPSLKEYQMIKSSNELLAWVLVSGRCVNHFGINIRLLNILNHFKNLEEFNDFIENTLNIKLHQKNGKIQGSAEKGVAQSSTEGEEIEFSLPDGKISHTLPFMEFIWRSSSRENPVLWKDYFTGFIGAQAVNVVESVYVS